MDCIENGMCGIHGSFTEMHKSFVIHFGKNHLKRISTCLHCNKCNKINTCHSDTQCFL